MTLDLNNLPLEVVGKHRCELAECPVWDSKRSVMFWVDIYGGTVHEYSPADNSEKVIKINQMTGSLSLCRDGNLIIAIQDGFAFLNRLTGVVTLISDPEEQLTNNRFNEGKCDPAGRFWAGTMSLSEEPNAGNLYMIDGSLAITRKIAGVTISNGMAWSADHRTFYYIDTPTREVAAYDFDKASGEISNYRSVVKIKESEGSPDGMAIDAEGMLWIAHWNGWQISRWDPTKGKQLASIKFPVAKITSCTFAGKDLSDLYITSASAGLSKTESNAQPQAGFVFRIKNCGFRGLPGFEFNN